MEVILGGKVEEFLFMPVLPFIDLLILSGWSCLAIGAVLKAISATTSYQPLIMSLGPLDFVIVAVVLLLLAVTLAARTWVKLHEPELTAKRRAVNTLHAVQNAASAQAANALNTSGEGYDFGSGSPHASSDPPPRGSAGS
jgi:hypothetical protein